MVIHVQVADIKKPLLSITKVADMGFECVLGAKGGFLVDGKTGERLTIQRRGSMYSLKMWVNDSSAGFGRQG